jgi:hydroxymethylpyrimidine/phosphomethylpyrimidine kinase
MMRGKVLTIAGSDSSGGAGIQADIKTISALGSYAMTAITAITVQNTNIVSDVYPIPAYLVKAQIEAVLSDIGADVIKTGMLLSPDIILAVGDILENSDPSYKLVVDPVMMSTSGHMLLKPHSIKALTRVIFNKTTLLTPNLAEAAKLANMSALKNIDDMRKAGEKLMELGPQAVLIKGGHLEGDILTDILITQASETLYSSRRVPGRNNHGTGCTLASAIATGLAQDMTMEDAVARAHAYVHKALEQAPGFGTGCGPINHLVKLD